MTRWAVLEEDRASEHAKSMVSSKDLFFFFFSKRKMLVELCKFAE